MRQNTAISTKQLARSIAENEIAVAEDLSGVLATNLRNGIEDTIPVIRQRLRKIVEEINIQRDDDARKADVDALIGDEPSLVWDIYNARKGQGLYADEEPVTL